MAISIKSLSLTASKTTKDATKKELPQGNFSAVITGIKEDSFRGREGYMVKYNRAYFTVGKAKYDCSLTRLCFPSRAVRDAVIDAVLKGESVEVTLTSTVDAKTNKLGYDVC